MRIIFILLITALALNADPQQPNFRTYSSVVKLNAYKGNDNYQWENKDNIVFLNYKIPPLMLDQH